MHFILDTIFSLKAKRAQAGFTMIELLIVIAILGILAVAVLSAINPVEQINRGRDTGSRSDAEQLLSAIDRYNAFKGYFPWMDGPNDADLSLTDGGLPVIITDNGPNDHQATPCHFLNKLSVYDAVGDVCGIDQGTEELKVTFINRITNDSAARSLYIYNSGTSGASTYVCFDPQSKAFRTDAEERCEDPDGNGLPGDLPSDAKSFLCAGHGDPDTPIYTCLP
jgi:prepilin-type N-terminal cleavage/methylation domain-containing protein